MANPTIENVLCMSSEILFLFDFHCRPHSSMSANSHVLSDLFTQGEASFLGDTSQPLAKTEH